MASRYKKNNRPDLKRTVENEKHEKRFTKSSYC